MGLTISSACDPPPPTAVYPDPSAVFAGVMPTHNSTPEVLMPKAEKNGRLSRRDPVHGSPHALCACPNLVTLKTQTQISSHSPDAKPPFATIRLLWNGVGVSFIACFQLIAMSTVFCEITYH